MRLYTIGDILLRGYDLVIYKRNERIFVGELVDYERDFEVVIRRHYAHSEDEIIQYFRRTYFGKMHLLDKFRRTVLHGGRSGALQHYL